MQTLLAAIKDLEDESKRVKALSSNNVDWRVEANSLVNVIEVYLNELTLLAKEVTA